MSGWEKPKDLVTYTREQLITRYPTTSSTLTHQAPGKTNKVAFKRRLIIRTTTLYV